MNDLSIEHIESIHITVTHYDEYMDDGYGFEDNGSGYHWEDYSIYAEYYLDSNDGYCLDFTWDWNEMDNTDSILDTIGEIEVEFYY